MFKTTITLSLVVLTAFASLVAMPSSVARGDVQNGDYTIGPLFAFGEGTPAEAAMEAQAEMLTIIEAIIDGLGPSESFGGFSIISETSVPSGYANEVIYTIEFEVYIQSNRPPR